MKKVAMCINTMTSNFEKNGASYEQRTDGYPIKS